MLYVVLGSDCDPDRLTYGGSAYDSRAELKWEGVRVGVARAREIASRVAEDLSVPIHFTWCVRSDAQLGEVYGDPAWPYRAFADMWEHLAAGGDELAWHPHLWRWDDAAGCWYQEIEDEGWIAECLSAGHQGLSAMVGDKLTTCRMGWEFHNDLTMQAVGSLGLRHDFSAIPGWFTPGEASRGSRLHCYSDWRGTPCTPYVPSRTDYRRPATGPEDALGLWELPMSVFESGLWGGLRSLRRSVRDHGAWGLASALSPTTWRSAPNKAYVTVKPQLFGRLVASVLQSACRSVGQPGLLVTAFHPDELLEEGEGKFYSSTNFEANLRLIINQTRAQGFEPVFGTVAAIARTWGTQ